MRIGTPKTKYIADDGTEFDDEDSCLGYEEEQQRLGMEAYRFHLKVQCQLRDEFKPKFITCPGCSGRGEVGGGFKSLDGPQTCTTCYGRGSIKDPSSPRVPPQPKLPKDLQKLLVVTWNEWWAANYPKKPDTDRGDNLQANHRQGENLMLIDPEFSKMDEMMRILLSPLGGGELKRVRLREGVYELNHFNMDSELKARITYEQKYPQLVDASGENYFGSYGVCDCWEQVIEACPMLIDDPKREFVISVKRIDKSTQPEEGGWRWHKWGGYIGNQEPTCEYIYDEPLIEAVYCYHIYEMSFVPPRMGAWS